MHYQAVQAGRCQKCRITSYNVCYTKLLRTLVLTSVFNKNRADVDKFSQYGINAYKVILSNYGKNEHVKSYFNDIYQMTVNYIDTHDNQYLDHNKHIVIR